MPRARLIADATTQTRTRTRPRTKPSALPGANASASVISEGDARAGSRTRRRCARTARNVGAPDLLDAVLGDLDPLVPAGQLRRRAERDRGQRSRRRGDRLGDVEDRAAARRVGVLGADRQRADRGRREHRAGDREQAGRTGCSRRRWRGAPVGVEVIAEDRRGRRRAASGRGSAAAPRCRSESASSRKRAKTSWPEASGAGSWPIILQPAAIRITPDQGARHSGDPGCDPTRPPMLRPASRDQRKRSSRGGALQGAAAPGPSSSVTCDARPRTITTGSARGLVADEVGRGGDLVGDRDLGRRQLAAVAVVASRASRRAARSRRSRSRPRPGRPARAGRSCR